jgi:G2/mitotic-specific cyclin 3/4
MAAANQLKAGTKRTAFGDLSNLSHQTRPSKDDSLLPAKSTVQITSKPVPAADKKAAPLTRPAQRPMSVSNLKSFLTGGSYSQSQETVSKPSVDPVVQPQAVNSRKVLSKRNTTIFRDTQPALSTVVEAPLHDLISIQRPSNASTKYLASIDPPSTSSISLPPPVVDSKPVSEPVKEDSVHPVSEASLPGIESVSLESQTLVPSPAKAVAGDPQKITESNITNLIPAVGPVTALPALDAVVKSEERSTTSIAPAELLSDATAEQLADLKDIYLPNLEEYQYDEEESVIEEEGYVTARSFHSKSENTTGGVTTLLFPQMNARIRRELKQAADYVEATRSPDEVEDEQYDTSMVAEYGEEIFEYMREKEVKMLPNAHYMDAQHEIQWSMRSVLMDWLIQVHHRFNLLPETLFLCVNYIDRFLSCKVVSLGKLQLVGATAIFIAAKYEEINCPSIQEIVYMVDNGYSVDEILKAERFMLTMLQFELGWPGPMSFLRRISKADDYDLETRTLAKYFLEITIMDERFIGSPPSFAAAASHCLARLMLRKGGWVSHRPHPLLAMPANVTQTQSHMHYSGYTFSQLRPLVKLILDCCEDPHRHHQAVYNKYCDKRYKRAAVFVEDEIAKGFTLQDAPIVKAISPNLMQPFYDSFAFAQG